METLLEQLVHSPKLNLYSQKIQDILQEEQQRRMEFYNLITEQDKAEFINGEIIFHSPVKLAHNRVSNLLLVLLSTYVRLHNLGYVGHERIMISLSRNDYEPDLCFFSQVKSQQFSPNQIRFPAPDLVVEILSDSTAERDRGVKFEDYAAHGVGEYWLVDPDLEIVEQYGRRDERYELLFKLNSGILKSVAVDGFEIPVRAMFDEAENLNVLQQILDEQR